MDNRIAMCSRLMITMALKSTNGSLMTMDKEYNEHSFIARVLRKKMEVFEIPVKIPDDILVFIEVCVGNNPGYAQLMLKDFLGRNFIPNNVIGYTDIAKAYPISFPIVLEEGGEWEIYFSKKWQDQKAEDGSNLCDTRGWWMESFHNNNNLI